MPEQPRISRAVCGFLGVLYLVLAVAVLVIGPLDWRSLAGVALLLLLALDFLVAAVRSRSPRIAALLPLP